MNVKPNINDSERSTAEQERNEMREARNKAAHILQENSHKLPMRQMAGIRVVNWNGPDEPSKTRITFIRCRHCQRVAKILTDGTFEGAAFTEKCK